MATVEVKVPDIGDFAEVEIIELMVKIGDTVKAEQSLITVESDKASMEIPSSHAGVVKELKVKVGDKVKEGSLVLVLETAGAVAAPAPATAQAAAPAAAEAASAPAVVAAALPAAASAGPVNVLVPDIGDFDEVTVIEVMVAAGDAIKVEQSLITSSSGTPSSRASLRIVGEACGSTAFATLGSCAASAAVCTAFSTAAAGAASAAEAAAGVGAAAATAGAAPAAA